MGGYKSQVSRDSIKLNDDRLGSSSYAEAPKRIKSHHLKTAMN